MKIIFKKIKIKNFMSVGSVPIEFDYTAGLHRVTGVVIGENIKNGVGKSQLFLDALIFALFGKSIRGLNLDQMINSINEKECEITLWLEINDVPYKIERGLKPNYLRFINENIEENNVISRKSSIQQDINNTIKISYTTFINTITMNVNYSEPFFKLNPAEKRQILDDATNISIFGKMFEKLKKQYNEAKNDKKILISELNYCKENYKEKVETFSKIEQMKLEFENNKTKDIEILNEKINKFNSKLTDLQSKIPNKDYESFKIKILEAKDKLKNEINKHESEIFYTEKQITNNKNKINNIQKNPKCPECGTPNTSEHVSSHIKLLQEELEKNTQTVSSLNNSKDILNTKLTDIISKEKQVNDILKNINLLNSQIIECKNNINILNNQLKEVELKQFNMNNIISNDDIEKSLEKVKLKEFEYNNLEKNMFYMDYSKEILGEKIKSYVIKKLVPLLNKKMNEYLALFKANYTISFDNELNETLKSRKRDVFSYNNFSSGEQKRIDLAMMFTLLSLTKKQNSIDCNILILDEVLDTSICKEGIIQLMDFLKVNFKKEHPNLCTYIISHKEEIGNENFDSVINLKKDKNFTKIDSIETINKILI